MAGKIIRLPQITERLPEAVSAIARKAAFDVEAVE